MKIPGYTVSLLIWIIPVIAMSIFFIKKRLLTSEKIFALAVTIFIMSSIGVVLDLLFAGCFFRFDNTSQIIGIKIHNIPIEEFVFYITGFWFIVFLYVFCDEYFLLKYNVPDRRYARMRSILKRKVFLHYKSLWVAPLLIISGTICKRIVNPDGEFIPGYFTFLVIAAYIPFFIFFRVTRSFVNFRGFVFCIMTTLIISIVWEVNFALPGGYWGYRDGAMLGLFIKHFNNLPWEAVTVWIFSSLIILVYEFIKICYFTPVPTVPCHSLLLKIGRDWRGDQVAAKP
jgi:hypothetical protein